MGTANIVRGSHVTAGTKTVHLVANVRPASEWSVERPYPYCSATFDPAKVVATDAAVTCKSCAKHL